MRIAERPSNNAGRETWSHEPSLKGLVFMWQNLMQA